MRFFFGIKNLTIATLSFDWNVVAGKTFRIGLSKRFPSRYDDFRMAQAQYSFYEIIILSIFYVFLSRFI